MQAMHVEVSDSMNMKSAERSSRKYIYETII